MDFSRILRGEVDGLHSILNTDYQIALVLRIKVSLISNSLLVDIGRFLNIFSVSICWWSSQI